MSKRAIRCIVTIVTILLLLFTVSLILIPRVTAILDRGKHLHSTLVELNNMVEHRETDINKYQETISTLHAEVDFFQNLISPYYTYLRKAENLPEWGPYALQVEPLIEGADHALSATEDLLRVMDNPSDNPLIDGRTLMIARQINENQAGIRSAHEHTLLAKENLSRVDIELIPETYRGQFETAQTLLDTMDEAIHILTLVPQITGAEKPATYLIMVQNSDELRATGGWITAFGVMRIENGCLTVLDFRDSSFNWISERVEAPRPLKEILFAHYWLPRDANWSPEFSESARQVQQLFYLSTGINTEGVIAVHQSTLKKLLSFTGPLTISGEKVDANNVEDYMIAEKLDALSEKKPKERKDFIRPLFFAILEKLPKLINSENSGNIVGLAKSIIDQGDILLMSNNPEIQEVINQYHLSGDFQPGDQDFLMLVDSNLGYNKVDKVLNRNIKYEVDLSKSSQLSSRLEITYKNPLNGPVSCIQGGDPEIKRQIGYLKPACYWNFWRVYLSKGSQITNYTVHELDPSLFLSNQSWTPNPGFDSSISDIQEVNGLVIVPTESTRSVVLQQSLPLEIIKSHDNSNQYSLTIQKQPGIKVLPLHFVIKIPTNSNLLSSNIALTPVSSKEIWEYTSEITQSRTEISVIFSN